MVVGDFTQQVQTVIIGAGPGGYVAAIRAAQLGQEVVLIEKELLGGVCLNWGCIPSKAMIEVSGLKQQLQAAAKMGLIVDNLFLDMGKMHQWKDGIVEKLRNGIASLLKQHEIDHVKGRATIADDKTIMVDTKSGLQRFAFENLIIATGSQPRPLPDYPFDGEWVLNSSHALGLTTVPENLVVVGAGSVGLEMGTIYAKLGSKVTIVEAEPDLLPGYEPELARVMARSLKQLGIRLLLETKVTGMERKDNGGAVTVSGKNEETIPADKVLVSIGRYPDTATLGLQHLGVATDDRGYIIVDEQMRTSAENVYAIGDLVKGPMLAHRASHMGKIAAEVISGEKAAFDNLAVPGVIFSDPEIAVAGLTEAAAKAQGIAVKSGVFPFRALGRAMTLDEVEGLTKIVSGADTGTVLGVHIIGPHASDLIAEGALAIESGLHYEDMSLTIHAHPTLPEGLGEAAEAIGNKAIHIFSTGK